MSVDLLRMAGRGNSRQWTEFGFAFRVRARLLFSDLPLASGWYQFRGINSTSISQTLALTAVSPILQIH